MKTFHFLRVFVSTRELPDILHLQDALLKICHHQDRSEVREMTLEESPSEGGCTTTEESAELKIPQEEHFLLFPTCFWSMLHRTFTDQALFGGTHIEAFKETAHRFATLHIGEETLLRVLVHMICVAYFMPAVKHEGVFTTSLITGLCVVQSSLIAAAQTHTTRFGAANGAPAHSFVEEYAPRTSARHPCRRPGSYSNPDVAQQSKHALPSVWPWC
jgi:hypothetical protein